MKSKRKKPIKVVKKKVSLLDKPYIEPKSLNDWILRMYLSSLLDNVFLRRREDRTRHVISNLELYVKEQLNNDT